MLAAGLIRSPRPRTVRHSVERMSRQPKGVPMINSFHEQGSPLTLLGRALGSIPPGT